MLDGEVREKFKEFQQKTGKYGDLDIDEVRFVSKIIDDVISQFIKGSTPKYSISETNHIVIKSGQARGNYNKFNFKKIAYLDTTKVKNIKLLKKGDILINTTGVGTAGRVTLFDLDKNYVSDSHITTLRYDLNLYNKFYLLYFFVNFGFKKLESMAEGTGGQIELSMNLVKKIQIPIPKSLNKKYTSFKLQEAIVEFLEFWKAGYTDIHRNRVNRKIPILETIERILVPNTFKYDKKLVESFNLFSKKKGYDLNFKDIEFEKRYLKTLVSTPVKGGGTPDTKVQEYWHNDFSLIDNINYFGWRNIEKKLFNKKTISKYAKVISKKGFESNSTWLVPENSILIAIASASKGLIVINNKQMCTNQNILGVVINEKNNTEYIYYFLKNIYRNLDGKKEFGNLTKGSEENREILIPKRFNDYSSKEIQLLLVDFWEMIIEQIDSQLKIYDKTLELADKIDEAFLYRTFSKIDWSSK